MYFLKDKGYTLFIILHYNKNFVSHLQFMYKFCILLNLWSIKYGIAVVYNEEKSALLKERDYFIFLERLKIIIIKFLRTLVILFAFKNFVLYSHCLQCLS